MKSINISRRHLPVAVLATALIFATNVTLATDLVAKSPWVRSTVNGQKASSAFMEFSSPKEVTIIGVSSPMADVAEIHSMIMEGNVMRMRHQPRLTVSPGKTVKLTPTGYHIMLMDLKQQLKAGDFVPITLQIEQKNKKIDTLDVKAEIRDINTAGH